VGRGPISGTLISYLREEINAPQPVRPVTDPLGDDDLQLALFVAHELHYRGFDDVADDLEWDPALIEFRTVLESAMLDRLIDEVGAPQVVDPTAVPEAIFRIVEADDGPSLSRFLALRASEDQFKEFVMHRSAYQLKEA